MPFLRTIEDFLPFAGEVFLSNFLFAAFRVFIPCLSFGLPQPQVAHITSSSFVGRQSQILLACRLCPYQASFALVTFSLQTSLQSFCNYLYSLAFHMIYTLFLTFLRFSNFVFSLTFRYTVWHLFPAFILHTYLNVSVPARVRIFSHYLPPS